MEFMKIIGIDEAGRGSVLGPLVVSGVAVEEDRVKYLERLGLKDSKKISPKRRVSLSRKIERIAECHTVNISAHDIDTLRSRDVNLNEIEKIAMMKIIKESQAQSVIIDSVDVNPSRLCSEISEVLGPEIDIKAEHGADDNYVVVAAASIVAKVERDMEIEKLSRQYRKLGNLGSGYPSDPRTKAFLKNFKYDNMPEFVRKSWATVKKMKDN